MLFHGLCSHGGLWRGLFGRMISRDFLDEYSSLGVGTRQALCRYYLHQISLCCFFIVFILTALSRSVVVPRYKINIKVACSLDDLETWNKMQPVDLVPFYGLVHVIVWCIQ